MDLPAKQGRWLGQHVRRRFAARNHLHINIQGLIGPMPLELLGGAQGKTYDTHRSDQLQILAPTAAAPSSS